MVLSCLEELNRQDVIAVIKEEEKSADAPQVFISYQWDMQEEEGAEVEQWDNDWDDDDLSDDFSRQLREELTKHA